MGAGERPSNPRRNGDLEEKENITRRPSSAFHTRSLLPPLLKQTLQAGAIVLTSWIRNQASGRFSHLLDLLSQGSPKKPSAFICRWLPGPSELEGTSAFLTNTSPGSLSSFFPSKAEICALSSLPPGLVYVLMAALPTLAYVPVFPSPNSPTDQ